MRLFHRIDTSDLVTVILVAACVAAISQADCFKNDNVNTCSQKPNESAWPCDDLHLSSNFCLVGSHAVIGLKEMLSPVDGACQWQKRVSTPNGCVVTGDPVDSTVNCQPAGGSSCEGGGGAA